MSKRGGNPAIKMLARQVAGKQYAAAEVSARNILKREPSNLFAQKAFGFALVGQGRFEEALPLLEKLTKALPQDNEVLSNLGIALFAALQFEAAIAAFAKAHQLNRDDFEIACNLGMAYTQLQRWEEAIPVLLVAIEKHPGDYVEAVELLAVSLLNANRLEEAIVCFRELWEAGHTNIGALYRLIFCYLRLCQWESLEEYHTLFIEQLKGMQQSIGAPFFSLSMLKVDLSRQRQIAALHAGVAITPYAYGLGKRWVAPNDRAQARRLRVGYLSADLRRHPVGFALPAVIENHDRGKVEVFGFSMGADDDSGIRRRLAGAFEHFVDVGALSLPDTLDAIRQTEIDILIDLHGWTSNNRTEILAMRAAPIQVNWLGYAGTIGDARLADYIVGDAIATPAQHQEHYAEAIAQLPHCYLPFDSTRRVADPPTRRSQGLPDDGFVFCSLNNSYKFNPAVLDLWAELLRQIPDSVLWLTHAGDRIAENLRSEISRRGIAPGRLLFAMRVEDSADHLARIQLADLALDPFPYNSHSSGSETLWAGVPMVTLLGDTFAGRVGASLLHAAGLDELVTKSEQAYLDLALELCRDRVRLARLRERLVAARETGRLFDAKNFANNLEQLYARMWHNLDAGKREPIGADPAADQG